MTNLFLPASQSRAILTPRFGLAFPLLLVLSWFATLKSSAAIAWGSATALGGTLKLLAVFDDASQKAYFQMSGPADQWFGWGFGSSEMSGYAIVLNSGTGTGTYFETMMQQYVQPSPDPRQELAGSYCVLNNVIYYSLQRSLAPDAAAHYTFTTQPAQIPITWAIGTKPFNMHSARDAASLSSSNAPSPALRTLNHAAGTMTLSISNLVVGLTNRLEFSTNVNAPNWTVLSNLVFSAPCGSQLFSFTTNVTVAATNSSQGFYRVRQ